MPSPVFTGDPPRPLFIEGGGGVVPALADDPCACCGDEIDLDCCDGSIEGLRFYVTVEGVEDAFGTCPTCEAFNTTFVSEPFGSDSLSCNRCDLLQEGQVWCNGLVYDIYLSSAFSFLAPAFGEPPFWKINLGAQVMFIQQFGGCALKVLRQFGSDSAVATDSPYPGRPRCPSPGLSNTVSARISQDGNHSKCVQLIGGGCSAFGFSCQGSNITITTTLGV